MARRLVTLTLLLAVAFMVVVGLVPGTFGQEARNNAARPPASVPAGKIAESPSVKGVALANSDVLDMLKTGLSPEIITAKIKGSACNFDTSPSALGELKAAGAPEPVILAMVQAPVTSRAATAPLAAVPPSKPSEPVAAKETTLVHPEKSTTLEKSIPPGAKVYIEPAGGFENYLGAGFLKKQTPVTVVPLESADFIIHSTVSQDKGSTGKAVANAATCALVLMGCGSSGAHNEASISVSNKRTGEVVYSYSVKKGGSQLQSAAEAFAKHLKHFIEGTGK